MIVETIYAGRDNTFSLRLVRGGVPEQLQSIRSYDLVIEGLRTIVGPDYSTLDIRGYSTYEEFKKASMESGHGTVISPFIEKYDAEGKSTGVVEVVIGHLLTEEDIGSYKAYLVTYDAINTSGVKWPTFKLKVK